MLRRGGHAQPCHRSDPRRRGHAAGASADTRGAAADVLRLPRREGPVATAGDALARSPAHVLRDRAAPDVPREAARDRANERDGQGAHRRRAAEGRRYHLQAPAARAGDRYARRGPHGAGAGARHRAPLQLLPPVAIPGFGECAAACRPA